LFIATNGFKYYDYKLMMR